MRLLVFIILTLGAILTAQVLADAPSLSQATATAPSTAPTTTPDTLPATSPATTEPATQATTQAFPVTLPTTGPETMPATQAAGPTTSPSPTTSFATSGPATRLYPTASSYSQNDFRPDLPPPVAPGGPDLTPKPYPRQYSALLSRSVFVKGSQRVSDPYAARSFTPGPLTTSPTDGSTPSVYSPEGNLVFNGASDVDGELAAFVENIGMNQIGRYHVGDAVNQGTSGRITAITLDSIDYSRDGRVTHILIGQNLLGAEVQLLTTQPVGTSVGGAGDGPTTGPTTGPGAPSGAVNDMLERLRQRRLKELGG
jgi:hypothetical protein